LGVKDSPVRRFGQGFVLWAATMLFLFLYSLYHCGLLSPRRLLDRDELASSGITTDLVSPRFLASHLKTPPPTGRLEKAADGKRSMGDFFFLPYQSVSAVEMLASESPYTHPFRNNA
jgi:hypothetical protein